MTTIAELEREIDRLGSNLRGANLLIEMKRETIEKQNAVVIAARALSATYLKILLGGRYTLVVPDEMNDAIDALEKALNQLEAANANG